MSHGHHGTFRAYAWRARWLFLASLALTQLFHYSAPGHLLDGIALDTVLRVRDPERVENLAIVAIDDESYEKSFGSRSPLDAGRLRLLLEAVKAGGAKRIGVDIDTSDPSFATLGDLGSAFVWATDVADDTTFEPKGALGVAAPTGVELGIPLMPVDADGVVRRYRRCFHTKEGTAVRSLVVAMAQTSCDDGELLAFNFAGDRYEIPTYPAEHVMLMAASASWGSGVLSGRVVLVGGSWRAARDQYVTPVGLKDGVEVLAHALATEMGKGGIRDVHGWVALAVDVALGVLLLWIGWRLPFTRALVASLATLTLGPALASVAIYSAFSHWLSFLPLLLGVFLHMLFEHGREYLLLREELAAALEDKAKLAAKLAAMETRLETARTEVS